MYWIQSSFASVSKAFSAQRVGPTKSKSIKSACRHVSSFIFRLYAVCIYPWSLINLYTIITASLDNNYECFMLLAPIVLQETILSDCYNNIVTHGENMFRQPEADTDHMP